MRFLVIGIDRNTGAAMLLTETPLPTRQDAIDALGALAATDLQDLTSYDTVLIDLDAATPVVVVPAAVTPAPAVQQPMAEELPPSWTGDAGEQALGQENPVETVAIETGIEDFTTPSDSVAFAPDAFAAADEAAPDTVSTAAAVPDETWPASTGDQALDAYAPVPSVEAVRSEDELGLTPVERASAAGGDEAALLDALRRAADSLVEQGVEVPAPVPEALPQPVEAADVALLEDEVSVSEPMGVAEAASATPGPEDGTLAEPESAETAIPPVDEPLRPVIMGEYPDSVTSEPAEPLSSQPYQPSGDLEIAAYTCDDCVYSNTCPKAGESSPADCGTFQWRSF